MEATQLDGGSKPKAFSKKARESPGDRDRFIGWWGPNTMYSFEKREEGNRHWGDGETFALCASEAVKEGGFEYQAEQRGQAVTLLHVSKRDISVLVYIVKQQQETDEDTGGFLSFYCSHSSAAAVLVSYNANFTTASLTPAIPDF